MPVNTSTYYGTDGILTLSDAAPFDEEQFTDYFGEGGVVGRLTDVIIQVNADVRPFHEIGSRTPKELRTGNVAITGRVERAHINGALLRLMLGGLAEEEETAPVAIPSFNMKLTLDHLRHPEGEGTAIVTIYGAKFDSWQMRVPEDDFVLEHLTFQALRIKSEDTALSG